MGTEDLHYFQLIDAGLAVDSQACVPADRLQLVLAGIVSALEDLHDVDHFAELDVFGVIDQAQA